MQMTLMLSMRMLVRAPVMLVSALVLAIGISTRLSQVFLVALPLLAVVILSIILTVAPKFKLLQERTDGLNWWSRRPQRHPCCEILCPPGL